MNLRAFGLIFFCLNGSVEAEEIEFRPLLEVLPTAIAQYPSIRCVALYSTMIDFLVDKGQSLTEAQLNVAQRKIGYHLVVAHAENGPAATQRLSDGTTDEGILIDIEAVSALYLTTFRENYASYGQPDVGMVVEDLQVCQAFEDKVHE